MRFHPTDTAVVVIDPQIDVLSLAGRNWTAVGASVTENDTVAHLAQLMEAAVTQGYPSGATGIRQRSSTIVSSPMRC